MRLSDLFSQSSQNITNTSHTQAVQNDPYQQNRMNQEIRALKPGQTLQGEVVGRNGNEVQIRLNDDMILNARLEKSMEMEPGKVVTFEVKNNSGGTLALSPLFENMGTDANVLKALEMAGLPVNKASVSMTEAMMQGGMSIDRNSLASMFRQVMNFPESQPASVVELQQLGMEVTPENLQQLENYKNLEHQIIKDLTNILDEIPFQFESMMAAGDTEGASAMYQALLDLVVGSEGETAASAILTEDGAVILKADLTEGGDLAGGGKIPGDVPEGITGSISGPDGELAGSAAESTVGSGVGELQNVLGNTEEAVRNSMDNTLLSMIGREELSGLTEQLGNLGMDQAMLEAFSQGTLTGKEALAEIAKALAQLPPDGKEALSNAVFSTKGFQNLLQQNLSEQWLLTPEEVRDKGNVKELYERMDAQLARLGEAFSSNGKMDNPLAKSVTNLQNNLDFMNQINQVYSYVQLPLKMSEGKAHGDLYVYANKKSLASKDGSVSALLHLDMEHLGPVDVYVAMQEQRVNTHFYLADEEMLDFIEANIHILNERLEKKGYAMNTVMSVKAEEKTAVEEMLDNGQENTLLSQYSFDVRA